MTSQQLWNYDIIIELAGVKFCNGDLINRGSHKCSRNDKNDIINWHRDDVIMTSQ